jgi:hypothetical protein
MYTFLFIFLTSCSGQIKSGNLNTQNEGHDESNQLPDQPNPSNSARAQIIDKNIRTIFQDKKGIYWIGTNGAVSLIGFYGC